ncbi:unnamed protein product [Lepeophtheirus salmonis]|uniref:(salmon louse) hypothetical protein n=1 Tax=Lepeophtheirus salmonis TaxID=72036 RepID=A0A7R8CBX3_LEPSM|nr:unnamed protein product [Lepeophtheirus salmonis]CAF2757481.1 unnamed protein product [Lepeophtheirus salmonis]
MEIHENNQGIWFVSLNPLSNTIIIRSVRQVPLLVSPQAFKETDDTSKDLGNQDLDNGCCRSRQRTLKVTQTKGLIIPEGGPTDLLSKGILKVWNLERCSRLSNLEDRQCIIRMNNLLFWDIRLVLPLILRSSFLRDLRDVNHSGVVHTKSSEENIESLVKESFPFAASRCFEYEKVFVDCRVTLLRLNALLRRMVDHFSNSTQNYSVSDIVSLSSEVFDTQGYVSPVIMQFKLTLPLLWEDKFKWDKNLKSKDTGAAKQAVKALNKLVEQIPLMKDLLFPRYNDGEASRFSLSSEMPPNLLMPKALHETSKVEDMLTIAPTELVELTMAVTIANYIQIALKPLFEPPRMAPLPTIRMDNPSPWRNVGIDLMALFAFLHTRAIHVEIFESCCTRKFLETLKRYVCLYGKPEIIYSYNSRNFVAANKATTNT